jgi:beta-fructofuranosidase
MNDPNGLAFRDGRLHVFFQHEPDSPRWGRMCWGHAASRDLVTWEHLPIALEPGAEGPDRLGCWSGCLVVDDAGLPTIFYTGVVRDRGIRRASICRATSHDGLLSWTKDPGVAVIARPPVGIRPDRFRDPFVWRDDEGWSMLVGAGTVRGRGAVLVYHSDDLRTWEYGGPFLSMDDVVSGDPDVVIEDIDSPCWECPQLVGFDGLDVLIVSVVDRAQKVRPDHVVAFTGRVVGRRFHVDRTERLGLGPDFYAPATVTAPDGRRLLLGWIPEDPPARRSSRTWAGSLTLPRVVSVDPDGRTRITLAAEVARFEGPSSHLPDAVVQDGAPWTRPFDGGHFELRASIDPGDAMSIRIDIGVDGGGPVAEIRFDPRDRRFTVTRTGQVLTAGRDPHGSTILPPTSDGLLHLRLILDGSVLELVADERVTATARLPGVSEGGRTISCTAIGGRCRLVDLEVSTLGEPFPETAG